METQRHKDREAPRKTANEMIFRRISWCLCAFVSLFFALITDLTFAQPSTQRSSKIGVLHIQGNVYLLYGAGANITMQVGNQAVVLVDSGPAQLSEDVRAAIRTVTN